MFSNVAIIDQDYWDNIGRKNDSHPFYVSCCGVYRLYKVPVLSVSRPHGRVDYQILYVASGEVEIFHKGELIKVGQGNIFIYRPKESQVYKYYSKSNPEVYWVHFSGNEIDKFLLEAGIEENDFIIDTGIGTTLNMYYKQIISELQLQKSGYMEAVTLYLRLLILHISRSKLQNNNEKKNMLASEKAIQYFNEFFNQDINIEVYAKENFMSVSWFIRTFKARTGLSPLQYITNNRMSCAKDLLMNTPLTVTEISNLVGYSDALYFSRAFKKHAGVSPLKYRNSILKMQG